MQPIDTNGTLALISGFSLSGIKGRSISNESVAVIIKGGNKKEVRTGGSADVESFIDILQDMYSYVEVWRSDSKNIDDVSEKLTRPKVLKYLSKHNFVFIIYSGASGKIVKTLHSNGITKLAFRAQNPEFFHRFDYFRISGDLKFLALALLGLVSDMRVCRYSKVVIPISRNDMQWYFKYVNKLVGGKAILFSISYFPRESVNQEKFTTNRFFLIGSSTKSTLISSVDRSLSRKIFNGHINLKHFYGIGYGLESIESYLSFNYGFQEDLNKQLGSATHVIIPTTSGWGFKTKIADLLAQGKIVVVHKKLARKIDVEIRKHLIVVNKWEELPNIPTSIQSVQNRLVFEDTRHFKTMLRGFGQ